MKNKNLNLILKVTAMFAMISFILVACKKDDPVAEDPIASFQYEVDGTNYLLVNFTNYSQYATSYMWDFGDGNTSTDENPSHTFTAADTYTVKLTASNADGASAEYSQSITITDPLEAQRLLFGDVSKTWHLHRLETSLGVGPDAAGARAWFSLANDGSRPCVYGHEFTFYADGSFEFNDNGEFWGEAAVWDGTALKEICFEAIAANMVNKDGADVSDWLSGTHSFTYDPSAGEITLTGQGAWMGLPQLGTTAESIVPEAGKTFNATIEEFDGYDLMTVSYAYADLYWDFTYASYDNPDDEVDIVLEEEPFGEDLPDVTPTELGHTFESDAGGTGDLDTVVSVSTVVFGATDPDGGGTNVGEFTRTADQYQELKMMIQPDPKDIQFDNFTSVSVDVYFPSSNDYTGDLAQFFEIAFADASQTENWWESYIYYNTEASGDVALDEWVTLTYDITDVLARTDIDMIVIRMGGNGHTVGGTFYIRNLVFN